VALHHDDLAWASKDLPSILTLVCVAVPCLGSATWPDGSGSWMPFEFCHCWKQASPMLIHGCVGRLKQPLTT
jgi:hypothetical protein